MKFSFTINTLFIVLFSLFLGYGALSHYIQKPDPYQIPTGALPVPIQVGKNKIIVSKTGDASMSTEYRRRRAIIGSNSCGLNPKFSHQGSTNGSLETYFLSAMCPSFLKLVINGFDGGNAGSNFQDFLDGNEPHEFTVDGGNVETNSLSI